MSDKNLKKLNSNPCPGCRPISPVCRCQTGGSQSQLENSSNDNPGLSLKPNPAVFSPENLVAQNPHWALVEDADFILNFEDAEAMVSIQLDMGNGSIQYKPHPALSREDKKDVNAFFIAVKEQVLLFNKELVKKNPEASPIKVEGDAHQLTLIVSDFKIYDLFIQQLINNHLLPHQASLEQKNVEQSEFSQSQPNESKEEPRSNTAPTPFDISRGPRPKGWDAS